MSDLLPDWATTTELKQLYGSAKGLGADASVLSDLDVCKGYVQSKKSRGAFDTKCFCM